MSTGAVSGMGLATAQAFSAKKARLVPTNLNAKASERVAAGTRAAGGKPPFVRTDVTDQPPAGGSSTGVLLPPAGGWLAGLLA